MVIRGRQRYSAAVILREGVREGCEFKFQHLPQTNYGASHSIFAGDNYRISAVGWVERSDTRRLALLGFRLGIAALNPTCEDQ